MTYTRIKAEAIVFQCIMLLLGFASSHAYSSGFEDKIYDLRTSAQTTPQADQGRIILALSLVWEGEEVSPLNIDAIAKFREEFAAVNLIQFLNPAYFTKNKQDHAQVRQQMARVVKGQDTLGLHLHGWKSLVEASGVNFRSAPSFWGYELSAEECKQDCGHEVPLSIYTEDEVEALVKHGLKVLQEVGFAKPRAFMAGGWMAAPHVIEAVVKQGFSYDFSAVPPSLLENKLRYYPLLDWLKHLWFQQHATSQASPYYTSSGSLMQVSQNGASIDYRSHKEIFEWFKSASQVWQQHKQRDQLLHLSFYQESAHRYLPRLKLALQKIFAYSQEHQVPLVLFESLERDIAINEDPPQNRSVSLQASPSGKVLLK